MGQAKTTIELNGKLYDATTGEMVPSSPSSAAPKPASKPPQSRQVMDGFFRPSAQTSTPKSTTAVSPAPSKPKRNTNANHKKHHKPEHSQTLMRHVVSKPKLARAPTTAKQVKEKGLPQPSSVKHDRQKRAEQTSRSSLISRFSANSKPAVEKTVAPLPVKPHPKEADLATPTSAAQKQFKQALSTATSHQQTAPSKPKLRHRTAKKLGVSSRTVSVGASILATVLIIAFIAYQSVPNISMRVASSRAGFQASLPGYTPSGFGVAGPIKTNPGTVTINFKSNSDDRSYSVSQSPTNWNSQALLNNYVASNNKSYQTVEDKGKTVYIYGGSNATWVNGGVWYRVTGNANLSSQQLTSIADSL